MTKPFSILLIVCAIVATAAIGVAMQSRSGGDQAMAASPVQSRAAAVPAHPVLVELFTSQGCSSCPPADEVLGRLADNTNIVAITRPVTYWDQLGWRDTLGREANTRLQRAYAARGLGGGSVFTPEAVVNGSEGLIGSRESEVRRLIANANSVPAHILRGDGTRVMTQGVVDGDANLRFVAVANTRSVRIGGGENGGRLVNYHNVVLDEADVACTSGARCSANVPTRLVSLPGKDRIAVILQRPDNGAVLAVRWL